VSDLLCRSGLFELLTVLELSSSQFSFKKDETGSVVCEKEYTATSDEHLEFLRKRIEEAYMHSWVIDNMPVVWCYDTLMGGVSRRYCTTRFPLGCFVNKNGRALESCAIVVS